MSSKNKNPYVVIGMPIPRNKEVHIEAVKFCFELASRPNVEFIYYPSHSPAIGRNEIILKALKVPQMTHIFFLDSDTVPPKDALDKLLAHDKDVVAGITPTMSADKNLWSAATVYDINGKPRSEPGPHAWHMGWLPEGRLPEKLFSCFELGGTTILVKREVFNKIKFPYFLFTYRDTQLSGEDNYFSEQLRAAKIERWCDPTIKCDHYHTMNMHPLFEDCG